MALLANVTVGTGWTAVDAVPTWTALWNVSDEAILVRFAGAGDSFSIASARGIRVPPNQTIEAQCASGGKTLAVFAAGCRPYNTITEAYPDDLVALAHWDTSSDLTYARDGGSLVAAETGNVQISAVSPKFGAGSLDLIDPSTAYCEYIGAGIVDACISTFTVSCWYRPNYSGSPSAIQFLHTASQTGAGNYNRGWQLLHVTTGVLRFRVYDDAGVAIALCQAAWAPTANTWYHVEVDCECGPGGMTRVFVDGNLHSSVASTTARTAGPGAILVGKSPSAGGLVNDYCMDELQVYDTIQHTSNFTPPTEPVCPC